jgi:chemotaxis protein MotB
MAKREKIHEAEKDRSERWLLTYSDLITLLLIYFIVMFSMSTINARKFEAVTNSLAIILGSAGRSGILTGGRTTFPSTEESKEKKAMKSTEERINRMIGQMGLAGKITATMEGRGLVISVKDTVFFQRGSAELTPRARDIMETVGRILSRMPNSVRIEGHTDNDPIHTPQFFSNWELSTARATNVLQYLVQSIGFPPERLSAAGYG